MRACRWCAGTTGPELSHSILSLADSNGRLALGGWVMRCGIISHAKGLDIVAFINVDGLTARGGRAVIKLEDGERIEIDITQRSSFITGHDSDHGGPNSYVCSENVSRTRINGREGVCCFTVCNDVTGMGEEVMMVLDRYSTLTDGLSCQKSSPALLD